MRRTEQTVSQDGDSKENIQNEAKFVVFTVCQS